MPLLGYQNVRINTQCDICSRIHRPRWMHVCAPRYHRPAILQQWLWTWLSCVLPAHR